MTAAHDSICWSDESQSYTTALHRLRQVQLEGSECWLSEELTVSLANVAPDVASLFFVIQVKDESHGVCNLATAGVRPHFPRSPAKPAASLADTCRSLGVQELPRVRMKIAGRVPSMDRSSFYGSTEQEEELDQFMYDSAVSVGAAESTEGVLVARLYRARLGAQWQLQVRPGLALRRCAQECLLIRFPAAHRRSGRRRAAGRRGGAARRASRRSWTPGSGTSRAHRGTAPRRRRRNGLSTLPRRKRRPRRRSPTGRWRAKRPRPPSAARRARRSCEGRGGCGSAGWRQCI